ncbi:MAG TPA: phage holin family protein [Gemmatimonadales bacterium]|nr:phage holin family protein [Gemmatimonadales bacterium]
MTFLVRLLVNTAALFVAAWLVPGIRHDGSLLNLLIVALLFGLVNSLLRPLLTLLTCPLILLTLGLFSLVINALMLMVTGWLSGQLGLGFHVDGFWAAFVGGLIVGLVSVALSLVVHDEGKHD